MLQAWCRPGGRLCCFALVVISALGFRLPAFGQSGPAMTTVADTVYQADGTPASGTLIITWPAFVTGSGTAIAAGTTNVTLGTGGALSVALMPNAGATPAGVYYTVVYQLGPGQVKTEYWVVPATSPANLAAVRATPGAGVAGQPVSMEYVNSQLANVVHLSGAETITGPKTFSTSPSVPAPTASGQVASKGYVDQAVSTVGAGNYLPTAGGTMTGPITLPSNPASAMQAATKQYVDMTATSKADLIAGLVPASELGTGLANSGSCLVGNGASATWGACGGGSGSGNVSTTPSATQSIAQPAGTQFAVNNLANIRYVTPSWNWAQTPADNLATPGNATIHLAPCPLGLDTASASNNYVYKVYLSGTGTAEAVPVTGGNCAPGAANGTITVTTANPHAAGYVVGSASSGIQEAWNDGWTTDYAELASPYVKLVSNTIYNVYATVFLRGRGPTFDGTGAQIACYTRDRCFYLSTTQAHPGAHYMTLLNVYMNPALLLSQQPWSNIASISAVNSGQTSTLTIATAANHGFVVGDTVDCEYSTTGAIGHFVGVVNAAGFSAGQFTTTIWSSANFSAGAYTFGFCHILNAGIEDNSDHVVVENFQISQSGGPPNGVFTYGFVNDNDQHAVLNQPTNRSSGAIDNTYPTSAFIYQRTDQGFAGITNVEDAEISGVNCFTGGGNGMTIKNSVCQGFPVFGVRYFGGLQPATVENVYQESSGGTNNPLYGYGAAMGYLMQGGPAAKVVGTFPGGGLAPTFNCAAGGSASTKKNYFVIPKNGAGAYGPMMYIGSSQPAGASACGGVSIPVSWPAVLGVDPAGNSVGALTYDLIYTTGTALPPQPGATANYVEINSAGVTCNMSGMCSVADPQTESTTYALPTQGNFAPKMWFWPAPWVMNSTVLLLDLGSVSPGIVSNQGFLSVSSVSTQCMANGQPQEYRSQIWATCLAPPSGAGAGSLAEVVAQFDAAGNGPLVNSKGFFNFGNAPRTPTDLITMVDSNLYKTLTTNGNRPSNDAGDMSIGLDQAGGMDLRAAASVSTYINTIPSGTNFQERLTGSAKTFNVPVTMNGGLNVTAGTVTLPVTGSGAQCLHVSATGALSGTGADCGSGGGGSGTVTGGLATQLALYAGSGTSVSGDSALSDTGTTLNYSGSGGISATSGTFSGSLTVNGQLMVAGPWMVSSPIPGSPMGPAGSGTSALGISNDGYFYISPNGGTPQKVATSASSSYFTNLFQEDPNDLGMWNSTTPQSLHVYSSYTNSSTWTRASLGYDTADGYSVLRSESSPSGSAPGLGFWLNSGLKWVIDGTSNFKPWQDQAFNIGSFSGTSGIGLRPATVYVAGSSTSDSGFELGKFANNSYELCNDAANGTVVNGLAVLTTQGCAVKPASAVTTGVIGVVIANAGTSGTVTLVRTGSAYCSFDGTATAVGDYVVASPTLSAGSYPLCHDAGATLPSGAQILGRVLQATGGGGLAQMFFDMPGSSAGPSSVGSVFGRTGAITAASGDYTCAQVTNCTPTTTTVNGHALSGNVTVSASDIASGALTNGTTATTQTAGDASTKLATDQFVTAIEAGTYATWGSTIFGTTGLHTGYGSWTTPTAITVTGFDLYVNNQPAGCTTYGVLQIYDNTASAQVGSYTITLNTSSTFYTQVNGSANVASGHVLTFRVATAAAGCTTNASNIVGTLTYVMQTH